MILVRACLIVTRQAVMGTASEFGSTIHRHFSDLNARIHIAIRAIIIVILAAQREPAPQHVGLACCDTRKHRYLSIIPGTS